MPEAFSEAVRLVATPDAPVPPGGQGAEWFAGVGGERMRAALFAPEGKARGSVVLSTGRSEYIEKYFETIGELVGRGFVVLAHDWRSQGLSKRLLPERMRGHVDGFDDLVGDFGLMLEHYKDRLPKPWIAMAHSMGGCLTMLALTRGVGDFAGAILSAPMLEISTGAIPRWFARPYGWLVARSGRAKQPVILAETDPSKAPFHDNILTHDIDRFERNRQQIIACPDLALGSVTWGWVDSAMHAISSLHRPGVVEKVTIPVTFVTAGDEKLVKNRGTKAIVARLPHGRYVELQGAYHEILQENDHIRDLFWREFDSLAAEVAPAAKPPIA
ncbi:MAG: alpha/beta hydrolase [Caulobacteraceae bacterium]